MAANRNNLWRARTAALTVLLLLAAPLAAQTVYRWVDENGEVHFNTTLPPEYANRPHQIIRNGIVIREVTDPTAPEPTNEEIERGRVKVDPDVQKRELRMRADRLLLLKYRTEDDIHEAMEVEVANLDYDRRLIDQALTSVLASIRGQVREAADRQRAGLAIDDEVNRQINQLRARIRQSVKAKASLQQREEFIRAEFLSELERYRFLNDGGTPGAPIDAIEPEETGP